MHSYITFWWWSYNPQCLSFSLVESCHVLWVVNHIAVYDWRVVVVVDVVHVLGFLKLYWTGPGNETGNDAAKSLAMSVSPEVPERIRVTWLADTGPSQAFWMQDCLPVGLLAPDKAVQESSTVSVDLPASVWMLDATLFLSPPAQSHRQENEARHTKLWLQLSLWQMGRMCVCWPIWSICLSCYYYYYYQLLNWNLSIMPSLLWRCWAAGRASGL